MSLFFVFFASIDSKRGIRYNRKGRMETESGDFIARSSTVDGSAAAAPKAFQSKFSRTGAQGRPRVFRTGKNRICLRSFFRFNGTERPGRFARSPWGDRGGTSIGGSCVSVGRNVFSGRGQHGGEYQSHLNGMRSGDAVVVQRDVHKSVIHGLVLAGANPIFLRPREDMRGIPAGIIPDDLEALLEREKHVKAVLITSPNYYGIGTDVRALSDICHRRDIPLLVDEAHGAHFGFASACRLPPCNAGRMRRCSLRIRCCRR